MWQELKIHRPPHQQGLESTQRQREEIDYQAGRLWISYAKLLEACSEEFDRPIHDLGELRQTEACRVLKYLLGRLCTPERRRPR